MKKLFVILMLCLSQSGCLAVAVVEGVTDVAIAVLRHLSRWVKQLLMQWAERMMTRILQILN